MNNQASISRERIHYIDVLRGIAMILVILGHSIHTPVQPNRFILAFHMPIFYFISGMCFRYTDKPIISQVFRILRNKGIPYLTLSIIGVLMYFFISVPIGWHPNPVSWEQAIIGIFYDDWHTGVSVTGGFWVFYDLLYISLAYVLLSKIPYYRYVVPIVSFCLFLTLYYFNNECGQSLYGVIERQITGLFFYSLGDICYSKGFSNQIEKMGKNLFVLISVILFVSTVIISQINDSVIMAEVKYGNPVLFIVGALGGGLLLLMISIKIKQNKFLEFVGRNTLIYLLLHFYFIYMVNSIIGYEILFFGINQLNVCFVFVFIITFSICTVLAYLQEKYIPYLTKMPPIK